MTIVGALAEARAAWSRQKEQSPDQAHALDYVNELLARAVGLQSKPDVRKTMADLKWLEGHLWRYLKGDQSTRQMLPDKSCASVAMNAVVEILQDVLKCPWTQTPSRGFFPAGPLSPELKGDAVAMILQFALRGEASFDSAHAYPQWPGSFTTVRKPAPARKGATLRTGNGDLEGTAVLQARI